MLDSLKTLLEHQVKDLYNAENQLIKALPRMAKKARNPRLKEAFEAHLAETREQVKRLEAIASILEIKPSGKTCKAMLGLIAEGKEVLDETGHEPVLDAALIAAAQRVEHYEISGYGTARVIAEQLGESKVVELLEQTLNEEKNADDTLSRVSIEQILPAAQQEPDQVIVTSSSRSRAGQAAR